MEAGIGQTRGSKEQSKEGMGSCHTDVSRVALCVHRHLPCDTFRPSGSTDGGESVAQRLLVQTGVVVHSHTPTYLFRSVCLGACVCGCGSV